MAQVLVNDTSLIAIADAIREKNGETEKYKLSEMVTAISELDAGNSKEEWIGDGNTHIWIHLPEGRISPMLGCCPNGTVTVDWGDGTAKDTLTGTSVYTVQWTPTHDYAKPGDYVITLVVDGECGFGGDSNPGKRAHILRHTNGEDGRNSAYQSAVQKVEIGSGITSIWRYAFWGCTSLNSITIPDSVTSIEESTFKDCRSLSSITIPDGVTSIGSHAFGNCFSLSSITIPDSVTSIGEGAFRGCHSFLSITIPNGVTVIPYEGFISCDNLVNVIILGSVTRVESYAFSFCNSIRYYNFTTCTSVPTLTDTYSSINFASDCEIRVPAALYDEWKAATNWSKYADHIVAV